ncbi:hypothetical protein LENED_004535 [Lentinula edodes]|uniref:Uncharacterized protein n=1 Tax=Lentinula edodes TaxID=5353 RepID=A0A1Q3E6L3_LENED|nr:hypothetical protein LENED_004535 [Lentinula edodes]
MLRQIVYASYDSNTHADNTKNYSQRPRLVPKFTTIISERHKIRYVHGRRSPANPQVAGRDRCIVILASECSGSQGKIGGKPHRTIKKEREKHNSWTLPTVAVGNDARKAIQDDYSIIYIFGTTWLEMVYPERTLPWSRVVRVAHLALAFSLYHRDRLPRLE